MKTLKDGGMGFYVSKWRYFLMLLIALFLAIPLFGKVFNKGASSDYFILIVFYCAIILILFSLYKLFIDKTPYVKIRNDSIEIRGMAPLLWDNIYAVRIRKSRRLIGYGKYRPRYHDFLCFEVRNLSLCNLTMRQKLRKLFGETPFELDLDIMSKEERGLFHKEICVNLLKRDITVS
ncbi:MAG: hypothetical protein LBI01_06980 [Elusimicrobium sp.]|jgi:hypothetical protein|nr:hypothetical protein [Elusimicrobium sp.]